MCVCVCVRARARAGGGVIPPTFLEFVGIFDKMCLKFPDLMSVNLKYFVIKNEM